MPRGISDTAPVAAVLAMVGFPAFKIGGPHGNIKE
jgi:hypothetical protein